MSLAKCHNCKHRVVEREVLRTKGNHSWIRAEVGGTEMVIKKENRYIGSQREPESVSIRQAPFQPSTLQPVAKSVAKERVMPATGLATNKKRKWWEKIISA